MRDARPQAPLGVMRRFVLALAAVPIAVACSSKSTSAPAPTLEDMTPTRPPATIVSAPLVGTGGFGFAVGSSFPGAAAPQGFAKVGPDTEGPWGTIDFLHCSGYWFGDDTVLGFSHVHLQGTGVPDYGVLGVMPIDAFDPSRTTTASYKTKMDKASEVATPGAYAVTLATGVRVEITATTHAAHHRFSYPSAATSAHVVVDLDHHLEGAKVESEVLDLDPVTRTLRGSFKSVGKLSGGFGGTTIYFAAKTKDPWTSAFVWSQGKAPAVATHAEGTGVGVVLDFDGRSAELEVALSMVSTDAAAANLAVELPAFDFDATKAATAKAWSDATSVVVADGGTPAQQAMLAAALYHSFLMPTIVSDADGGYVGIDGKPARADGWRYLTDMSLWDTYRTLNPLWDLVAPERARDAARSLVAMAKASGFFPKWPIGAGEAGTMIGASAEVVLADAYVKGIRDFDAAWAFSTMRAAAMDSADPPGGRGGRSDVASYMQLGYVPGTRSSSVSLTIEYGVDDFALAQLAGALGHADDAVALAARSHGWQKLFDPATGFLWAKGTDGAWSTTHGDAAIPSDEFDEANAWQSVWGPWYDADAMAAAFGGKDALVAKLESFFEQGKQEYDAIDWQKPLSVGARRSYYWGGNEPDIHAVYIFAMAGRPDLTQKWVRWIENEVYTAGADGIPGNDDGGAMSAWLVFSALGFYPIAGSDRYVVGAPMFPHAVVKVAGGVFTIDAPGVSDANVYVQSATLNGAPLSAAELRHADLRAGGSLVFQMGATPSTWGR